MSKELVSKIKTILEESVLFKQIILDNNFC